MAANLRALRPLLLVAACLLLCGCTSSTANERYFGQTVPPEGQQMRYISGAEPESLDPQIATGQPEARIFTALFEGLTEYEPRTGVEIPGLAERWEVQAANTVFVFHLRRHARWSDGSAITAHDVVYTLRRGLSPSLASRSAYLAYDILYAQAYNEQALFVRDPVRGQFLMDATDPSRRLVVSGDPNARAHDPAVQAILAGKQLVPVQAEDVGVDAIDDSTVRIRTMRSVPFLPRLLSHQFFRLVPRRAIEQYGESWTRPDHIVTSGPFVLQVWKPYDRVVVTRNPMYWDAKTVRLERITFYPLEELTTMMNLYKAGEADAVFNHVVPVSWLDQIIGLRDYMNQPEALSEFFYINVERSPMNDVRVRKAFNAAIDKVGLGQFRRVALPLTGFVPEGVFPGYPHPKGDGFDPQRARTLLAQAGYRDADGTYDPARFPVGDVELTYNTGESNRLVAEFVQAQWKQNLELTIPLKNMEFRTLLSARARREYRGIVRGGWSADYLDPFSFLAIFSTAGGENGAGWFDRRFAGMLQAANEEQDAHKRYDMLSAAEAYLLDAQPIIPLLTTATNWMKKPYVKGMYANPLTIHAWKFVYIEHDPARWD